MLDILVIFVKRRHNRFLKNIFEISLRCTVSTVGEMHEPILLITRTHAPCKVKLLATIVHNFQSLTFVIMNSILYAAVPKFNIFQFDFV